MATDSQRRAMHAAQKWVFITKTAVLYRDFLP